MTKLMRVAGFTIELNLMYEKTFRLIGQYLIDDQNIKPDLVIQTQYDDLLEQQALTNYGTKIIDGNEEHLFFDLGLHEFIVVYNKIAEAMPALNTFLMHGVAIGMGNDAYIFTAPSGVGKTTRANLWLECYPESFIINGDKPLIKMDGENVIACGTPWCGKEGINTNTMLPLRSVFFVERTEDKEPDSIQEISKGKAFTLLLKQAYFPVQSEGRHKVLELVKAMTEKVKFYRFRSSPSMEAIRLAYETIRKR